MEYHLNRKVSLSPESEFGNLYRWSLQEFDETGKKVGLNQIPWSWSLVFTATNFTLNESVSLDKRGALFPFGDSDEKASVEKTKVEERLSIRADLRPGYFMYPNDGERYSMFGTDRTLKSFQLCICKLGDDEQEEYGSAWGCLSYTSENDFRKETVDDTLEFYFHAKSERFAAYVEMIRKHPAKIISLRLGAVDGFYSEWSPMVSSDRIKVLTNLLDHGVEIPEGVGFKPPVLGRIGNFELTLTTARACDGPQRSKRDLGKIGPEDTMREAERNLAPHNDSDAVQNAVLQVALRTERSLKYLTYAVWAVVILLLYMARK